jgi:protein ImuB
MTKISELYACVYAKEFPAQAALRLRPELRNHPCVVMEGEPPAQSVCSLNARARVLGGAHGMTRVDVETLPGITTLSRSRSEEISAKAALLDISGTFSPRAEA